MDINKRWADLAALGIPSGRALVFVLLMQASSVAYGHCFSEAGNKYGIDPLLLKAIAQTESAMNPQALNGNRNGSEDIGLMQVNSTHLARLRKKGITRDSLLNDACVSVMVGADILAGFIRQFGYTWRAVGAYNAGGRNGRDVQRESYAMKVVSQYLQLKNNERARLKNER